MKAYENIQLDAILASGLNHNAITRYSLARVIAFVWTALYFVYLYTQKKRTQKMFCVFYRKSHLLDEENF